MAWTEFGTVSMRTLKSAGLVSSRICRQKEMVNARLAGMKETTARSKTVLDGHVFSMDGITKDAKRKWEQFSLQAKNDEKIHISLMINTADFRCCCKKGCGHLSSSLQSLQPSFQLLR